MKGHRAHRWDGVSLLERLMMKVDVDETSGCWIWKAATDGHGYGQLNVDGRPKKAYRVAYEIIVGPIPEGLSLDHLCRVTLCVNPAHLEPVTLAENTRRQFQAITHFNAAKTHCPAGHPYEGRNLRLVANRRGRLGRICVTCRIETQRRYRRRQAERKSA